MAWQELRLLSGQQAIHDPQTAQYMGQNMMPGAARVSAAADAIQRVGKLIGQLSSQVMMERALRKLEPSLNTAINAYMDVNREGRCFESTDGMGAVVSLWYYSQSDPSRMGSDAIVFDEAILEACGFDPVDTLTFVLRGYDGVMDNDSRRWFVYYLWYTMETGYN